MRRPATVLPAGLRFPSWIAIRNGTLFPPPKPEEPTTAEGVAGAAGHVAISGEPGKDGEGAEVHIDHYAVKVQKARDIAQADPKAVANIIKDWMGANAA